MGIPVSDEDFKDAESCIEHFLREFLEDCPIRDNVLFCCALGDVFAIKGEYEEGLYFEALVNSAASWMV